MGRWMAETGRPSIYSDELAATICARLAEGESLRSICRDDAMPDKATVMRWAQDNLAFRDQYTRARDALVEHWAEEIVQISDDGTNDTYEDENGTRANQDVIARSRLRVDTRKWLMARMAPKKYGDKVTQEHTGDPNNPVQVVQKIERVIVRPSDSNG